MNRRESIRMLLAFGMLSVPTRGIAQAARVRRIGLLLPNAAPAMNGAFRKRLSTLGWIEGQNLIIDLRHAENHNELFARLAVELVAKKVEVIVTSSTPGALAAMAATPTIPIVFAHLADPVRSKIVTNLARPGGNVTGVANLAGDIALKQFELLKALMPKLERVGFIGDPSIPSGAQMAESIQAGAEKNGVSLASFGARTLEEVDAAFAAASRERVTAMIVPPASLYIAQGKHIVGLARRYKIATAHQTWRMARW